MRYAKTGKETEKKTLINLTFDGNFSPNTDWTTGLCERTNYDVPGIVLHYVYIYIQVPDKKAKIFTIKLKCK